MKRLAVSLFRPVVGGFAAVVVSAALVAGCTSSSDDDKGTDDGTTDGGDDGGDDGTTGGTELPGLAVLGFQGEGEVSIDEMASRSDGLKVPRDLAFDPEIDGLLWVVNQRDDSVVHIYNAGTTEQTSDKVIDPYALHFMDEVSSLDFGATVTFGTCGESENTYNGGGRPNEFTGPSLWSSDLEVFGTSNPEAVEYLSELFGFPVDLGSHLDMLHESPLCMGIAWETDNVYWVVDGFHGALVRYDFVEDHGVGYDNHSDGLIDMHLEGELGYSEGIPAHLELDPGTRIAYVADPANERVLQVHIDSGEQGDRLAVQEPGTKYYEWNDTEWSVFLDGAEAGFSAVSGVELMGDYVLISDNTSGEIIAFDKEGNEVDRLSTGLPEGALMGMAIRSETEIWFTDAEEDRVLRLTPAE